MKTPTYSVQPPMSPFPGVTLQGTLREHKGTIYSLQWSPDGHKIASGAADSSILVWDAYTHEVLHTIHHEHVVSLVSWSPNGQWLVSGLWDHTVNIWNPETGEIVCFLDHEGVVSSLAWSPDGKLLVTGTSDCLATTWDVERCAHLRVFEGHTDGVISLGWSPSGHIIASGSDDRSIRLWDPQTGNLYGILKGHHGEIISVLWSPDNTMLCSGSIDETIHLWNVQSGDLRWQLEGFYGNSDTIAWSPDGRMVAVGAWNETIHLIRPETGQAINILGGHTNRILGIRFSADGRLVASKCRDNTVRIWRCDTGELAAAFPESDSPVFGGLAFHPRDFLLATRGAEGTLVHVWRLDEKLMLPARESAAPRAEEAEDAEEFVALSDTGKFVALTETQALPELDAKILPRAVPRGFELLHTLSGHRGVVGDAVWSPEGTMFASGAADQKIYLWDSAAGTCLKTLEGHTDLVDSILWSPDGQLLASASADRSICLWETSRGTLHATLKGHYEGVVSLSWSPNSQVLASGSRDKTVRLWDRSSGALLRTLEQHQGVVYAVAWSPNGRFLASASFDQTICLWDGRTGDLLRTLDGKGGAVTSLSWAPDSAVLASGCADNTVHFWDVRTGQPVFVLTGHTDSILCVRFSYDGRLLASKSYDGTVRLWRRDTGALLAILIEPTAVMDFSGLAFHPAGLLLATRGANDLSIRIWKLDAHVLLPDLSTVAERVIEIAEAAVPTSETIELLTKEKLPPGLELLHVLRDGQEAVSGISWSPDGQLLASASGDHLVRIWEMKTGTLLETLAGHADWVSSVAWSPDGELISSGSFDRTVRVWDASKRCLRQVLEGHRNDVSAVAWAPDGKLLASSARDQTIRIWDRASGALLHTFEGHRGPVYDIAWFPDGKSLVSASFDKTLRLWDVTHGVSRLMLRGHTGPITCVAVAPDGLTLASGSHDNTIRLWHAETGRLVSILETHTDTVLDVRFSPDGLLLASKAYDNTVRLWRYDSGDQVAVLGETTDVLNLSGLAFHPRVPLLATRGEGDRIIRIWRLDYAVLLGAGPLSQILPTPQTEVVTVAPCKEILPEIAPITSPLSAPDVEPMPDIPPPEREVLQEAAPPGLTIRHKLTSGHTDLITALAWSPNGCLVAAGSRDATITIWDADRGTLRATLRGHTEAITSLCWSPDGDTLVSGSSDRTIRLWDVSASEVSQVFEGHRDGVLSVAWAPDGWLLASGSDDQTVRLWDSRTGDLVWTFTGHSGAVTSVAWSPDSGKLVSTAFDNTIRIWDTERGGLLRTIDGSVSAVTSITWSPDGQTIAAGLMDHTIRLWQIETGQQITILEGHTDLVLCVEFSPDGRLLVSKSDDGTVRFWHGETGQPLAVLDEPAEVMNFDGLAFHPDSIMLATRGEGDRVIRLWQLDTDLLMQAVAQQEAHYYRNAKVVLVGDSGMGKSGLSLVLTGQPWEPTGSTHGRHVWVFDTYETVLPNGQRESRETLLWDLAGQPDYRLVHQLYLNEIVVALVVFDASAEIEAFSGVRHWSRALHQAHRLQSNAALPLKKFLVAARCDRSGLQISRERIDALLKKFEFDGFFETSAKEGWQIPELLAAVREAIDWNALPKVSSSELFQIIKQFLVNQKKAGVDLSSNTDLFRAFREAHPEYAHDAQLRSKFDTCVSRVENRDLIRRLSFGGYVLLQPELLDAYASALINAARSQPDGLGFIAEEDALNGNFKMSPDERLSDAEQEKLLLIATVEELLRHELILKETTENGTTLFVFPSQISREIPEEGTLPGPSVMFTFEGPLLNVYATLTIRLAQSGLFVKKDRWKNMATFTSLGTDEDVCGMVLRELDEGQGELALFFGAAFNETIRHQFEDYVVTHLKRLALPNTVARREVITCPDCGEQIPESMIQRLRERGRSVMTCPVCEHRISLLGREATPQQVDTQTLAQMDQAADAQRERDTAALILKGKMKAGDFDVFLCHNSKDKAVVKAIGERLKERGLLPWLDEWEFRPGFPWQKTLEAQIDKIKSAAVFIGAQGIGPWQDMEIDAFLRKFVSRRCPVIPAILEGCEGLPKLPVFLEGMMWVDCRRQEPDPFEQLIWGITGEKKIL